MGFSRQESWSGLLFPSPGGLPGPGIKPAFLMSSALAKSLPRPILWYFSCLPLRIFQFQALCLTLIHIVIFLSMVKDKYAISFFCMWISNFLNSISCRDYPLFIFLASLLKISWLNMCGFISVLFCPIDVQYVCSNYCKFIISLEVRQSKSSSIFFFFSIIVLVTLGLLESHLNFRGNLLGFKIAVELHCMPVVNNLEWCRGWQGGSRGRGHTYILTADTMLLYGRSQHSIVKNYPPIKNKLKKI